jgi:hypothetical protein
MLNLDAQLLESESVYGREIRGSVGASVACRRRPAR